MINATEAPQDTATHAQVRYAQEAVQHLREAIQHLSPEEKQVFLLRQNDQWTYEQIAQWRTSSVEVIKEQMRNALQKLRRVFQDKQNCAPRCDL